MEQVKQSLQNALAAIEAWQQSDKAKDERIAELTAQVEALSKAALPQVSVTGVPNFNTTASVLDVDWLVTSSTEQPLTVNVRHTDTGTGKDTDYRWNVAGKTGARYTYPLARIPEGVSFTILPGEGYQVKGEPVSIPAPKPAAKVITQREPFRITAGGVYETLHIRSSVSKVPCIELRTEQEVTLINCTLENAGYGIENHSGKTNLKVINCKAKGLPHDGSMNDPRRFLSVNNIIDLEVSNCETEHMGFLTSQGSYHGSGAQGIRVRYNHVRNVSGLKKGNRSHTNFVQLMNSGAAGIPNVQIAYNGVYNEYGQADVEDNINIYNARGRKDSRMQIHDNLIYGAFYHPSMERVKYYSGGGVITDGNGNQDIAPAFIDVFRNYIIGTGNYCLGMAAGFDLKYFENVCVVAGVLPDGRRYHDIMNMHTSGLWAKDFYSAGLMKGNEYRDNTVGVRHHNGRKDISDNTAAAFVGTRHLPDPITTGTERLYVEEWEAKFRDKLGVNW